MMEVVTNKINFDFSWLEFKDGIYSIKHNKFLPNTFYLK